MTPTSRRTQPHRHIRTRPFPPDPEWPMTQQLNLATYDLVVVNSSAGKDSRRA